VNKQIIIIPKEWEIICGIMINFLVLDRARAENELKTTKGITPGKDGTQLASTNE